MYPPLLSFISCHAIGDHRIWGQPMSVVSHRISYRARLHHVSLSDVRVRVEGRSQLSNRSSRWKINLKIQTSGEVRRTGKGWSEGELVGRIGRVLLIEQLKKWICFSSFEAGEWRTFPLVIEQAPHLRRSPPIPSIFGPILGAEDQRWDTFEDGKAE